MKRKKRRRKKEERKETANESMLDLDPDLNSNQAKKILSEH